MAVRTGKSPSTRAVRSAPSSARTGRANGRRTRRRAVEDSGIDAVEATASAVPAAPPDFERRRVRDIRLGSVARVSLFFYLCGLVAFMTAAVTLWLVASAFGVVGEIEGFMDDLGFEGFEFVSGTLLWASLLIGLAITAILVVLTVLAAAVYNLFADFAGGIEITLEAPQHERVQHNGGGTRTRVGNGALRS